MSEIFEFTHEDISGTADVITVFQKLEESFRKKHDYMTRCYDYTKSNMQLPDDVRSEFENDGRPTNAYNLISRVVKTLISMENANRKGVRALGVTPRDNEQNWLITKVLQYYLEEANFDYARTRAAIDAVITSYGVVYNQFSYAKDNEGSELIQVKDPRNIFFDVNFADIHLEKCKHIIERNDLTIEEMIDKYALDNPELQKEILLKADEMFSPKDTKEKKKFISRAIDRLLDGVGNILQVNSMAASSIEDSQKTYKDWIDTSSGKFTVLEVHERRTRRKMIFHYPELGQNEDVTEQVMSDDNITFDQEKIEELKATKNVRVFPKVEIETVPYMSAWCLAFNLKLLDQPYPHKNNGNYAYTLLFANDFHADLLNASGMVEELIDPQDDFNKATNMRLEFLARALSKGIIYEDGALDNFEDKWESKKVGQLKPINPGYWGKVRPEDDLTPPAELIRTTQEIPLLMDDISTVTKAMYGQQEDTAESGRHFIAKKNQSERGFIHFYDNIDNFSVQVSKNVLADIQFFVDEQKMVRISTDEDKEEFLTINEKETVIEQGKLITHIKNDITQGKFDIIVSNTPYTSTAKELEFIKLIEVVKVIAEIDPDKARKYAPVLLKASGTSYMDELLKIDAEQGNNPQAQYAMQIQKMLQELEIKMKQLELTGTAIDNQGKLLDNQGKVIEQKGKQIENKLKVASPLRQRVLQQENKYFPYQR